MLSLGIAASGTTAVLDDYLSFSGIADGSVPPAPWVVQASGTGTGVIVQSNRLQFTSGSSAGSYIGARAYMAGGSWEGLTDFDRVVTLRVENPIVGQYCNFGLRMDTFEGNGDYPTNGYIVSFRPQSGLQKIVIAKSAAGIFTQQAAGNISYPAGTVLKLWTKITGFSTPVIKVWAWPVGGIQPTASDPPTATWTDPSSPFTSGRWGFGASSDGASKVVSLDDIVLSEPGAITQWTPASLPNLSLWYDAVDASTLTLSGSNVTQWNDKSGNAANVAQATSGFRPTLAAAVQNAHAVVRFDATDDLLTGTYTAPTDLTVAAIGWAPAGGTDRVVWGFTFTGSSRWHIARFGSNFQLGNQLGVVNSGASWEESWRVVVATASGTAVATYVDGTAGGTGTLARATGSATQSVGALLLETDGSTYGPFGGDLGEIVVCSSVLSTLDRQKLEGYLAWRWGLQASLPGGHPYVAGTP